MKITVNRVEHEIDVDPNMPLLWVLRDELNIKGPKFGCGIAMCGACTVHLNGKPIRSCSYPISTPKWQTDSFMFLPYISGDWRNHND